MASGREACLVVSGLTQPSVACALGCQGFGTAPKQTAFVLVRSKHNTGLVAAKALGKQHGVLAVQVIQWGPPQAQMTGLAQGANLVNQTFRGAGVTKAFG